MPTPVSRGHTCLGSIAGKLERHVQTERNLCFSQPRVRREEPGELEISHDGLAIVDAQALIVQEGAIGPLLSLLTSGNDYCKRGAALALANLAYNDGHIVAMSIETGARPISKVAASKLRSPTCP